MKYLVILCVILPATIAAKTNTLPKYLKRCDYSKSQKDISSCLRDAMQDALVKLKNGDTSLGIQSIDPMLIKSLDIKQGNGPVSLNIHHRNMKIFGASQCQITEYEFDKQTGTISGKMACPKLVLDGDYEVSGRVLLLPVRGKGRSLIEMEKNECVFKAHGRHFYKNGVLFEEYNKIDFGITPTKFKMNFENLFNDARLSSSMNKFINDNWREILTEVKPSYEAVMAQVFHDTVNRVFSRIPVINIIHNYKPVKTNN